MSYNMCAIAYIGFSFLSLIDCLPTIKESEEYGKLKNSIDKDSLSEPEKLDAALVQNNLGAICERLKRLDKILTPMYKDPPKDRGEECVRFSLDYEQACLELSEHCKINRLEVLRAAREMVETGGSKFLEVDIDDDKVEERFKWEKGDVVRLHIIRGRCIEHWHNLGKEEVEEVQPDA